MKQQMKKEKAPIFFIRKDENGEQKDKNNVIYNGY